MLKRRLGKLAPFFCAFFMGSISIDESNMLIQPESVSLLPIPQQAAGEAILQTRLERELSCSQVAKMKREIEREGGTSTNLRTCIIQCGGRGTDCALLLLLQRHNNNKILPTDTG